MVENTVRAKTYLVRTMSRGARIRPAIPAAAIATPRDAHGYAVSRTSTETPKPAMIPGSGTFNNAANKLRDQLSMVFRSRPYTKVEFAAFQVPHAPSFVHNCESTSSIESGCRSKIWCEAFTGGVGEAEPDV